MSVAAVEIGDSVQEGLDAFFGFLPNLLAFLVILVVGYFCLLYTSPSPRDRS